MRGSIARHRRATRRSATAAAVHPSQRSHASVAGVRSSDRTEQRRHQIVGDSLHACAIVLRRRRRRARSTAVAISAGGGNGYPTNVSRSKAHAYAWRSPTRKAMTMSPGRRAAARSRARSHLRRLVRPAPGPRRRRRARRIDRKASAIPSSTLRRARRGLPWLSTCSKCAIAAAGSCAAIAALPNRNVRASR